MAPFSRSLEPLWRLILWGALALWGAGCSPRTTGPTEVGVHTRRLLQPGIEPRVYPPGGTYFFMPYLADWATFEVTLQSLLMTDAAGGEGALAFKTHDGNDIHVNVIVSWRIDAQKAPQLLARIGLSTAEVRDHLVRPVCRSVVRDVLNELHSEEYYLANRRFAKAALATERLAAILLPEGIIIEQVLLGQHHFNPEYEEVIHARKVWEQSLQRLRSEAAAAEAEQQRNLEQARGDIRVAIAQSSGEAAQLRIAADRQYYERDREARAILAERTATAAALAKQRRAMAGPGSRAAVKLRIAEALHGKTILIVPSAVSASLQQIDLNRLFDQARQPAVR